VPIGKKAFKNNARCLPYKYLPLEPEYSFDSVATKEKRKEGVTHNKGFSLDRGYTRGLHRGSKG